MEFNQFPNPSKHKFVKKKMTTYSATGKYRSDRESNARLLCYLNLWNANVRHQNYKLNWVQSESFHATLLPLELLVPYLKLFGWNYCEAVDWIRSPTRVESIYEYYVYSGRMTRGPDSDRLQLTNQPDKKLINELILVFLITTFQYKFWLIFL